MNFAGGELMADTNNLMLEHLRVIREDLSTLMSDMEDVRYRLAAVEQQVAGLRANLAHHSAIRDQFERMSPQIEKRLELSD